MQAVNDSSSSLRKQASSLKPVKTPVNVYIANSYMSNTTDS